MLAVVDDLLVAESPSARDVKRATAGGLARAARPSKPPPPSTRPAAPASWPSKPSSPSPRPNSPRAVKQLSNENGPSAGATGVETDWVRLQGAFPSSPIDLSPTSGARLLASKDAALVLLAALEGSSLKQHSVDAVPAASLLSNPGRCVLTKPEMDLVLRRLKRIVNELCTECVHRETDGHTTTNIVDEENHERLLVRTLYECDAFAGTEVERQLESMGGETGGLGMLRSYAERKGWYTRLK